MTYNQLQYYVSVAEELSITRTAERFHVSQPAVSFAIRELEKEYGIVLFERRQNNLHLTPSGKLVYNEAKKLLTHFDSFDSSLRSMRLRTNLSFALAPNVSAVHLPGLYPYIQKQLPDISLEMQELSIAQMTQMLKNGELDAALFSCLDDRKDPVLSYVPVSLFSLKAFASTKLFYQERENIVPEDLEGMPIVLQYRGSQLNTSVLKNLQQHIGEPPVIFYANQLFTIMEFVRKGLAIGFLPADITLTDPNVLRYSMNEILNAIPIYFVSRKENAMAVALKKVIQNYFKE